MPELPRGLSGPSNGRSEQDLVNSGLNPEIPLFKRGLGRSLFHGLVLQRISRECTLQGS